jgi:hypothetical protein
LFLSGVEKVTFLLVLVPASDLPLIGLP